jgi:hypothetical protein
VWNVSLAKKRRFDAQRTLLRDEGDAALRSPPVVGPTPWRLGADGGLLHTQVRPRPKGRDWLSWEAVVVAHIAADLSNETMNFFKSSVA